MLKICQSYFNQMEGLIKIGQTHPNIAYLYAIIGNISMAILQVLVKYATRTITSFQVIILRSVLIIAFNLMVLKNVQQSPYIPVHRKFWKVMQRIMSMGVSGTLMFFCISHIPVSTVITLFNTGPIFIFLIQMVVYKKIPNLVHLCLTLISFSGVVLIIQPQFMFGEHRVEPVPNITFYTFLVIISAFLFALNLHIVHGLAKIVHPFVNAHYSHICLMMVNGIMTTMYPKKIELSEVSWLLAIIIVAVAIATVFAQYSILLANSIKAPSLMMPFGYVGVMMGFWADVYLFGTDFSFLTTVGMLLTSSGLLSGYLASKKESTKKEIETNSDKQ